VTKPIALVVMALCLAPRAFALTPAEEDTLSKQFAQDITTCGKEAVGDCWLKAVSASQRAPLAMTLQLYKVCLISK
jgi:hypothetical protein